MPNQAISIRVRYTDEGCYEYVCTHCHSKTESRTPPQNFCTYCGTPFSDHKEATPSPKRARREAPQIQVLMSIRPSKPRLARWIFMSYKDDPTTIITGWEIYTRALADIAECLRLHRKHKALKFVEYWDCADEENWERAATAYLEDEKGREPHWFVKYHTYN